MATTTRTIRAASATWALLDAEADRRGISANALASDILAERLAPHEDAAPQVRRAAPKAAKAIPADPAQVAGVVKASEIGTGGGLMKGAMERAGIAQWDPSAKRAQYVRREAKGKAGR